MTALIEQAGSAGHLGPVCPASVNVKESHPLSNSLTGGSEKERSETMIWTVTKTKNRNSQFLRCPQLSSCRGGPRVKCELPRPQPRQNTQLQSSSCSLPDWGLTVQLKLFPKEASTFQKNPGKVQQETVSTSCRIGSTGKDAKVHPVSVKVGDKFSRI